MYIAIVGAGTVGQNIADYLSKDGYDVIVVDSNPAALEKLADHLDVQTIQGHALERHVLSALKINEIDCLLAVTALDETNLIIAWTYKQRGIKRVVARVRNRLFLDRAGVEYDRDLGIDLLICPERLVAQELIDFVDHPAALSVATYARGRVEMRRYELAADMPLCDKTLLEAHLPADALVVAVSRQDEVLIPTGQDCLQAGDIITVIGLREALPHVEAFLHAAELRREAPHSQRITIAGGGDTGLFLAETLERRGHQVKIIEHNRQICQRLSDELRSTDIIEGDATDPGFLAEEQVGTADYFLATTGDDENNFMSCLLARELGARKVCCLVDRPEFVRVIEKAGIDLALSPRQLTAAKILSVLRRGQVFSVSLLEDGKVEIVEFHAQKHSRIIGHPLRELTFPPATLIATVVHRDRAVIPRGHTVIEPGDIVIAVALNESASELEAMFHTRR